MVISAVIPEGFCKHMALDSKQLNSRSLEVSTALLRLMPWFSAAEKLELDGVRHLLCSQIQVASTESPDVVT